MKNFKEHANIEEGSLVMDDSAILDSIWNQVKKQLEKERLKRLANNYIDHAEKDKKISKLEKSAV